jgi:outer membrane protein assembly factor BamE
MMRQFNALAEEATPYMRLFHAVGIVLAFTAMAGCISPYEIEIQQGNVVTREMIDKLKPGMTRSQVRFVLGTPLVTDPFHPERWDYVYLYRKGVDAPAQTRQLTVIFDGDAMKHVEGDLAQAPAGTPSEPRDATTSEKTDQPQSRLSSTH